MKARPMRVGFVVIAWLAASGCLLDLVQVFAWGKMFVDNLETQSAGAALATTFSEEGKCDLCRALESAREGPEESPDLARKLMEKPPLLPIELAGPLVTEPAFADSPSFALNYMEPVSVFRQPPVPPPRAG